MAESCDLPCTPHLTSRAEFVVHPGPHDVELDLRVVSLLRQWEREGLRAEIEMQILGARRPVRRKAPLDAGARGPTDSGLRGRFGNTRGRVSKCSGQLGAGDL